MSASDKYNFADKTAIVTGGSRGLGEACVKLLVEYGCRSVASFSRTGKGFEGNDAVTNYKVDVSKVSEIERAVEDVFKKNGRIDILINNAGICSYADLFDFDEAAYDAILDVNLKGMFFMCQKVLPYMLKRQYGRIVNISSTSGITGGSVGIPYGMSKAGAMALTQAIGRKYAPQGILTNAVAPGEMRTDLIAELIETKEKEEARVSKIPVGRIGAPAEVAELVMYLASDLTTYTTGEIYRISGGRI